MPTMHIGFQDLPRGWMPLRDSGPQLATGLPQESRNFPGIAREGAVSSSEPREGGEGMEEFATHPEGNVNLLSPGRGATCIPRNTRLPCGSDLVIPHVEESPRRGNVHKLGRVFLEEFAIPGGEDIRRRARSAGA